MRTERLQLIPATGESLLAELAGKETFAGHLKMTVPENWPPELYGREATEYTLDCVRGNPDHADWWLYYIVLEDNGEPTVIGTAGYKGPPDEAGTVEVGYSILSQFRRLGFATEAVQALIEHALSDARVKRVIAETLPELIPSIGVLIKCGFFFAGTGSEEGVIRYTLERNEVIG